VTTGSKFLDVVLRFMPDEECRAEVRLVFRALMREGETQNSVAAFLWLIREHRAELMRRAEALRTAKHRSASVTEGPRA
jgi:anthranilate phosphoribosyltransferase